jgi:hypothetical protein
MREREGERERKDKNEGKKKMQDRRLARIER